MTPVEVAAPVSPSSGRADLARRAADAALSVPGVAGLSAGPTGRSVTYHSSGRVVGVALPATGSGARVSVVARPAVRLPDLAEEVRHAVGSVTGLPVDVAVVDLDDDGLHDDDHGLPAPTREELP